MQKHKMYMDIQNLKPEYADLFEKGDHIIIQEKIDGANVSFQYDSESDSLICFSRRQTLDSKHTLRGFYGWVQALDKALVYSILGEHLRLFGEWLVPHSVEYPQECYQKLYCFDVFNTETHEYLPQSEVRAIAEKLGLPYVPVFFEGEFTCWEDAETYVGKTAMGGEMGEGIVVKNMTQLPLYLKIVHEKFKEVTWKAKPRRTFDPETARQRQTDRAAAASVVTRARVEKLLHKFVDDGILPENFSSEHMPIIFKELCAAVYYDCMKEEPEIVKSVEHFGKYSGTITIALAKTIIAEREEHND